MRVCLFFTGGYDSTYILYKLLTETDHEVAATILVRNKDLDQRKDIKAYFAPLETNLSNVDLLVEELRKIRNFTYNKHVISASEFDADILSIYTSGSTHGIGPWNYIAHYSVENQDNFDMFVSGMTWEQLQKKYSYTNSEGEKVFEYGEDKVLYLKQWVSERAPNVKIYAPLVTHVYHKNFTRWHVFKYLPEQYKEMVMACANPTKNYKPCGKCYKCLWDRMVQNLMQHANYSSEQIEEYRYLKSLEYGGGNGVTAPIRIWLPIEMKCPDAYWKYDSIVVDTEEKAIEYVKQMKRIY